VIKSSEDYTSMDGARGEKLRRRVGFWRCAAIFLGISSLALLVALVVTVVMKNRDRLQMASGSMPCPPEGGVNKGLVTSGDPDHPSPFHDITRAEYDRVYRFLLQQPELNLARPEEAAVNTSNIFIMDLLLPDKADVLDHLDNQADQPPRHARVIVFRGDKPTPVVEE
jgi:hypothetical protein